MARQDAGHARHDEAGGTAGKGRFLGYNKLHADVAQPEEQRFRKPQVKGSSPFIGSTFSITMVALMVSISGESHESR